MAKNKISDLRDHLFATLEALRDDDKPMDIDRARAISEVAQTIINSAKVEIDLVKAVGGSNTGTAFLELPPAEVSPDLDEERMPWPSSNNRELIPLQQRRP